MTRPTGYSVAGYGGMIADTVRMDAYAAALAQYVTPGCVVMDIGCGTGIFSLLACRYGARKVYALEPDNAISTARAIAAANDYADRIEFIQEISTRVTLPERADVIVSDLRGVLPLFQSHLPAIADARERHLASGGMLIPQCDTLHAALVESVATYRAAIWLPDGKAYGFDMEPARRLSINAWSRAALEPETLLTEPAPVGVLDYAAGAAANLETRTRWRARRSGTAHGLLVWFDTELAPGIGFSNAPGQPALIYGQAFFPLANPVDVEIGDLVDALVVANLAGDDYVWRWEVTIHSGEDLPRTKADFRQSTFFAAPLSLEQLHKQGARYVPRLDEDGLVQRAFLALMDGATPLEEIARAVAAHYPDRFPDWRAALTAAGELARKYSR